ncbi:hypothetical protein [Agrococcus sp. Marseille-P2731]|uniref:hypothetical protein n=1 Tax=Agrococcus sp. Marseille-P2731 TaxID=1841862 RepID=UPI0009300EF8|nr:hypothetical protein [Agrococcus sp. Marseille-P2731]
MSTDEDALRWEGDDDLDRLSVAEAEAQAEADRVAHADASAAPARAARPRGPLGWLLLVLAVAATAGWVVIIVANPVDQPSLLGLAMYQLGELLAVIAPLLWWLVVDRFAPLARRAPWWLAGLVVTAPWPLVAGLLA